MKDGNTTSEKGDNIIHDYTYLNYASSKDVEHMKRRNSIWSEECNQINSQKKKKCFVM